MYVVDGTAVFGKWKSFELLISVTLHVTSPRSFQLTMIVFVIELIQPYDPFHILKMGHIY